MEKDCKCLKPGEKTLRVSATFDLFMVGYFVVAALLGTGHGNGSFLSALVNFKSEAVA